MRKRAKPRFWLILLAGFCVVMAFVYLSQNSLMDKQAQEIARLREQKLEKQEENQELERKIAFADTDEYIERTARDELGLLKPGEIRFVAPN